MARGTSPKKPQKTAADAHPTTDIAIVGGGMVGLTLALALARAGVGCVLIDREAPETLLDQPYDGRSSAIAQGSKRAYEGIGVWDAFADAASPIHDIRVSDGESRLFLHYDHAEIGDEPLGYIIENRAIRQGLLPAAQKEAGIVFLAPDTAENFESDSNAARVTLASGRVIEARLAIAADGRNSPLRQLAGIGVAEWAYPQIGIVCTAIHERHHQNIAHERFLPSGPLAFLPMVDDADGRHRSSIVWTERTDLAPALLALDDDAFAAELARRFGPSLGLIGIEGRRWNYPLSLLHADSYTGDRLVLVGDAAHAIHPIAGQGLNLGLRDVAALAEVLVDAHRLGLDLGSAAVLARYERWRRFDNTVLAAVTDGLNRLFSNDLAPVRLLRDVGMAAVNRMPPLKKFFMQHAMGTAGELPRLLKGERL